ncbi:MAG TPA: cell division protein ZapE [Arenimonas sp.]|nr:cell division protein ZapE [Arenimonas sp.]
MLPSQRYAAGVAEGRWQADPAQQPAVAELDRICTGLATPPDGLLARLGWRRPAAVTGLYLWGSVGRGKTFLTDLLFEQALAPKRRWHFHRFMVEVHARLRQLPDTADTVAVLATQLADELRLLVLDEFFVSDIADAMILGRLLDGLFARGVVLVTTSNIEPSGLYRDGLQRARFLPAIALLERHCRVLKLDSAQDYRLRQLTQASTYATPLGAAAEAQLDGHYRRLSADCVAESGPLTINGRALAVKAMAEGVIWFEFAELCEGPRAAADYIEIARDFHTVLLSNVPQFGGHDSDAARRFVHLVDEFYDRNVNLLLSAAAEPTALYAGERLQREFERTASRLIEMRSSDYLAREHRP